MNNIESIYTVYQLNADPNNLIEQSVYQKNNITYKILNYNKNLLCYNVDENIKLYRSVIFASPENELLSFTPHKMVDRDKFCDKYDINSPDIYINEYIDGTLIHLFYDNRINQWEIATKGSIGGNYKLFNKFSNKKTNKTVMEMFIDAFTRNPLSSTNNINQNAIIEYFPKNFSYSFVLLHPDNPIVFPINQPLLYLTNVFDITPKNNRAIHIPPTIFESWNIFTNCCILFPKPQSFDNWNQLKEDQLVHFNTYENNCGYIATHLPSGDRCKFYNSDYKIRIRVKTVQSKLLLQYLCLRKINLINDYLVKYPKFRKQFRLFKDHFSDFIENIHTAYLLKYVWKTKYDINEKYKQIVDDIQRDVYVPNIKQKLIITQKSVHDYILRKSPGEMLYHLFYENR